MRTICERCGTALAPQSEATICSYECTFCPDCAQAMDCTCPNCGRDSVRRPRRAAG